MRYALIVLGISLWLALAFNGGVGERLVNHSFFASAQFMVVAGSIKPANKKWALSHSVCFLALLYLPPNGLAKIQC